MTERATTLKDSSPPLPFLLLKSASVKGPTEKTITRNIIKLLEAKGFWTVKLHGGPMQKAGLPDIIAISPNRVRPAFVWVLALEVKRPRRVPTVLQEKVLGELRNHGAVARVVTSVEHVEQILGALELAPESRA